MHVITIKNKDGTTETYSFDRSKLAEVFELLKQLKSDSIEFDHTFEEQ